MWLLFIILPTLLFYGLIRPKNILKSNTLTIAISWFLGQYISVLSILLIAVILSFFTNTLLLKASLLYLIILASIFALLFKTKKLSFSSPSKDVHPGNHSNLKIVFFVFCFLFSVFLYKPHLAQIGNTIYTSPAYWDFKDHFPIIQNFVYGDNFPPQNESYAHLPMMYHYYFDLLVSVYSVTGLNLVGSINTVSIIMLFSLLIALIGVSEEFFNNTIVGYLTVLFAITSSSLRFINYLIDHLYLGPIGIISAIWHNTAAPFAFGLVAGNPAGYNGNMFNLFYLIAERHMLFGILFLLTALVFIYHRNKLPPLLLFISGCFLGQFFEGNLFIAIMIGAALGVLLLFDRSRKQTLFLLIGFSIVFLLHFFYLKHLIQPQFFYPEINKYPALNFNFPTMDDFPVSPTHFIIYYTYAYGLKVVFLFLGLAYLFKRNKSLFWLMTSIILPTFILINTVQLEPLSVYDNHKWLRPMNMLIDLVAALAVYKIFLQRKKTWLIILGIIACFSLTVSGFIELMPFLNSKPTYAYALYPTTLIKDIRRNTPSKSVFLSYDSKEIHLAGRKLFLGLGDDEPGATSVLDSSELNKDIRLSEMDKIYFSRNLRIFCSRTLADKIDYVALQDRTPNNLSFNISFFPSFLSQNEKGEKVTFLDIKKGCL